MVCVSYLFKTSPSLSTPIRIPLFTSKGSTSLAHVTFILARLLDHLVQSEYNTVIITDKNYC